MIPSHDHKAISHAPNLRGFAATLLLVILILGPARLLMPLGPLQGATAAGESDSETPAAEAPVRIAHWDENTLVMRTRDEGFRRLVARIDALIAEPWEKNRVTPAAICDDAEFVRRIRLDLTGVIPTAWEARTFVEDRRPDKRARYVASLLQSPAYAGHMAASLREAWLRTPMNFDFRTPLATGLEAWLHDRIAHNAPYDALVRELLTVPLDQNDLGYGVPRLTDQSDEDHAETGPVAWYVGRENPVEDLATNAGRIFLGVRLDCAQCHDHPFDRWKREQFWEFAAVFGGFRRDEPTPYSFNIPKEKRGADARRASVNKPNANAKTPNPDEHIVTPRFLDGQRPVYRHEWESPRSAFARWLLDKGNPYFARAAANRFWAHFLGRGLVHPVDEFGDSNPPSHPELLDLLAQTFADQGYDLTYLIQAITSSQAYQLGSGRIGGDSTAPDPSLFAVMAVKGLTGAPLYKSVLRASGLLAVDSQRFNPFIANDPDAPDLIHNEFRTQFSRANADDDAVNRIAAIPQILALRNGRLLNLAVDPENGPALRALLLLPGLTVDERIEALYWSALSRPPAAAELARVRALVASASSREQGLSDLFWALLNSPEFLVNH